METRATKIGLRAWTLLVVLFLHLPIVIIILYAFNAQTAQGWPITDWTTKWFSPTIHDEEMQQALLLSLKAALGATAIALLLGSAAAFAVHRFRFFGREAISFLFVLPIALPGIITGMALNSFFTFSLTLGDYITPTLVGGAGSTFIGNVVYSSGLGSAGNLPFAAAFASIPLVVMAIYLTLARRSGAFEAL